MERPRKLGAKVTGKDIQADEVLQSFDLTFDGKRDRYNGYDADNYLSHIQGSFFLSFLFFLLLHSHLVFFLDIFRVGKGRGEAQGGPGQGSRGEAGKGPRNVRTPLFQ